MGQNDKRARESDTSNDSGSNSNGSDPQGETKIRKATSEINAINDTSQTDTANETDAMNIKSEANTNSATNIKGETSTKDSTDTNITTTTQSDDLTGSLHDELVEADESLRALNSIRTELCRTPLNLCQRQYFNEEVNPLLTALELLSITSANLATAVNTLTTSPIVPRKKGKLKSTINLMYDINGKCKDVYKELERRIDIMIGED